MKYGMLFFTVTLTACTHFPTQECCEPINKFFMDFNYALDNSLLYPVLDSIDLMPTPLQRVISNVMRFLYTPIYAANALLQKDWDSFTIHVKRFILNGTAGVFGIIDVAESQGLIAEPRDMGQTLQYYGVGMGPFLVLPFLGPTSLRDLSITVLDYMAPPFGRLSSWKKVTIPRIYQSMTYLERRMAYRGFEKTLQQSDQENYYETLKSIYMSVRNPQEEENNVMDEALLNS